MKDIIRKSLQKTCSSADLRRWFEPLHLEFDAANAQISVLFPHVFFEPWFARQGKGVFERCAHEAGLAQCGREVRIAYRNPQTRAPLPLFSSGASGASTAAGATRVSASLVSGNSGASAVSTAALATALWPGINPEATASPASMLTAQTALAPASASASVSSSVQAVSATPAAGLGFDDFIVNAKNAFPLAAARQVAEATTPPRYNPFVMCGKSGTGKTHLVRALTAAFVSAYGQEAVHSASADILAETLLTQGLQAFAPRRALIVDDMQRLAHNSAAQEKLIQLMDLWQDQQKQLIFACSAAPASLQGLEEGLRSRLEVGLVVELKEADIDVRMRFAQWRCRQHNIRLDREHLLLLAQRCAQIRHLSGVILKVAAFHSLEQRHLDTADLENILRSSGEEKQITGEEIISAVATHMDISTEDILGGKRQPACVRARQWAMYLCREFLGASYPALGRLFGGRDHSTVMHAIKKIDEIVRSNKDAQTLCTELKKKCLLR